MNAQYRECYIDAYGALTDESNPDRMIWYSSTCTYWTDDWNSLSKVSIGIPACPNCKAVGYQTVMSQWNKNARVYDKDHKGYYDFIQKLKSRCLGMTATKAFEQYQAFKDGKTLISDVIKDFIRMIEEEQK